MENLSSDIVLEILTRLPKTKTGFESALQCRKVCRLWQNLLGKPKTGTLFTKSSKYIRGPVKLYYREQSCEMVNSNITEEEKLNFDKVTTEIGGIGDMCSFSLVGSLNGLVCYVTLGVIYILNPITGERICLSSVKTRNKRKRICLPKMDGYFDCAGFGYCHRAEAYKVVKIRYRVNRMRSVQVYTLGDTSGWRDKPDTTYEFGEPGVFPNGALYWFSKKSDCHTILAFDLADETFQCLPSPLPGHIHSYFYMDVNLGSLEGNLYLCHPYKKEGERMMDIWMFEKGNMKNCQGSTHLKEQTGFTWSLLFSRKWDSGSQCQLLSLTKSEILLWQNNVLSYYDPTNFKKIWYAERKRFEVYQAIPHMHSLVSLKDLGEKLVRQEEGHPKNVATR
ncbi:hypothetical protein MKX03_010686 [Papaver bracteatum]|nr:hypothetical protein MKX03_010686 [Papaver bracteatum]